MLASQTSQIADGIDVVPAGQESGVESGLSEGGLGLGESPGFRPGNLAEHIRQGTTAADGIITAVFGRAKHGAGFGQVVDALEQKFGREGRAIGSDDHETIVAGTGEIVKAAEHAFAEVVSGLQCDAGVSGQVRRGRPIEVAIEIERRLAGMAEFFPGVAQEGPVQLGGFLGGNMGLQAGFDSSWQGRFGEQGDGMRGGGQRLYSVTSLPGAGFFLVGGFLGAAQGDSSVSSVPSYGQIVPEARRFSLPPGSDSLV